MGKALLRALPPVGSPVPLVPDPREMAPDLSCGGRYAVHFLNSGTSALALALAYARRRTRADAPALLPAYGCPDLIAAATYAEVKPQLLDVEADTPWLSLEAVSRHVEKAAAVVAVNFLGMPERIDELAALARAADVPLIEDSAQMAPFAGNTVPRGDLVVFSFGRGKPIPLLSGGALLVRSDWAHEFSELFPAISAAHSGSASYLFKCMAYNVATRPGIFGLTRRLPFLNLGAVTYSPLDHVEAMAPSARARLGSAFARLAREPSDTQRALDSALSRLTQTVVNLPDKLARNRFPLLRYPLLARSAASRDALAARLDDAGLGASVFYGKSLAEIPGVPMVSGSDAPRAVDFARRLLTVPVHANVRSRDVDAMIEILTASA